MLTEHTLTSATIHRRPVLHSIDWKAHRPEEADWRHVSKAARASAAIRLEEQPAHARMH